MINRQPYYVFYGHWCTYSAIYRKMCAYASRQEKLSAHRRLIDWHAQNFDEISLPVLWITVACYSMRRTALHYSYTTILSLVQSFFPVCTWTRLVHLEERRNKERIRIVRARGFPALREQNLRAYLIVCARRTCLLKGPTVVFLLACCFLYICSIMRLCIMFT